MRQLLGRTDRVELDRRWVVPDPRCHDGLDVVDVLPGSNLFHRDLCGLGRRGQLRFEKSVALCNVLRFDSGLERHIATRQLQRAAELDLADVVDRVQTSLQFGVDTLHVDHFAVVDQCVPSLKPQIVDRKDDRLENADVVVVERTVDEDPRRPPLRS